MERNREGIRCASVPYKNCGFSYETKRKRNPKESSKWKSPKWERHSFFFPLWENRLLFSYSQKKGQPASGLKCWGLSSATSGLQVLLSQDPDSTSRGESRREQIDKK